MKLLSIICRWTGRHKWKRPFEGPGELWMKECKRCGASTLVKRRLPKGAQA